ncbi:SUMF1/EgtB/PvdO family nonheme iron enzyme [Nannocystis pusilla]|uniref:SUMF1/EgtB/PvdO family nonheme iron enzyme n=1 Tax=Nannocystis pusilla TaxID=889268 RepID=UPI003DA3B7E4
MTRRWLGLVVLLACTPHEHAREPQSPCAEGMVLVEDGRPGPGQVGRFCIDITEVTTAAYGACVRAGACTPTIVGDIAECNLTRADRGDHPVNCVDFEQARAYCSWLGKRLPNDEEWMYAARARDGGGTWPWGNLPLDRTRACIQIGSTCPVGQHPAGASPEGVQDLAGNVTEWTIRGEFPRLRGGSWREDPRLDFVHDPPYGPEATSGVRCVVAPFTAVDPVDLNVWTPYVPAKVELPVLAAPAPQHAPERPLANLAIVRRHETRQGAVRWWPVGDDWLAGVDDGKPNVLGLPGALEGAALPEGLRDFVPVRSLGTDLLLMRGGWGSALRFVAVERGTSKIRWQIPFANYGSTYEQFVAPRTFVAEIYGQQVDAVVGFGLGDGRELWRLRGGEQEPFTRASHLWTDGERGYVRGDRGLLAFDPTTGALLWSGVAVGEGCGVVTGDGALIVEEPGRDGHRRLDPATGAELGRIAGNAARCVWGVDPIDGGAAPAVLEDSRLFAFERPRPPRQGRAAGARRGQRSRAVAARRPRTRRAAGRPRRCLRQARDGHPRRPGRGHRRAAGRDLAGRRVRSQPARRRRSARTAAARHRSQRNHLAARPRRTTVRPRGVHRPRSARPRRRVSQAGPGRARVDRRQAGAQRRRRRVQRQGRGLRRARGRRRRNQGPGHARRVDCPLRRGHRRSERRRHLRRRQRHPVSLVHRMSAFAHVGGSPAEFAA